MGGLNVRWFVRQTMSYQARSPEFVCVIMLRYLFERHALLDMSAVSSQL